VHTSKPYLTTYAYAGKPERDTCAPCTTLNTLTGVQCQQLTQGKQLCKAQSFLFSGQLASRAPSHIRERESHRYPTVPTKRTKISNNGARIPSPCHSCQHRPAPKSLFLFLLRVGGFSFLFFLLFPPFILTSLCSQRL